MVATLENFFFSIISFEHAHGIELMLAKVASIPECY